MDEGSLYRKLLTTASHTQQQRHAELHKGGGHHLAGNVFLPAIQQRTSAQSALSMKHLEVIEQCILAENRREEQLAKCTSEKERRYLTKKFIAQREHERDLLQALMLGRPTGQDLEIMDVETAAHKIAHAATTSPHRRRLKDDASGVQILSASEDKVIPMHGERTFTTTTANHKKPTKAVSPHFHGVKSPARRREEQAKESMFPDWNTSPSKSSQTPSPVRVRPTRSASLTCKTSEPSPSRQDTLNSPLARSLAKSPLRQPVHTSKREPKVAAPSPSPTKRKNRVATTTLDADQIDTVPSPSRMGHDAISFSGATSFHEARQQAMIMLRDSSGNVDDGTQTTGRTNGMTDSNDKQFDREDQRFALVLTQDRATSPFKFGSGYGRPHSSPEQRRRRRSVDLLPALTHASSDTVLPRIEPFYASKKDSQGALGDRILTSDPVSDGAGVADESLWAETRRDAGVINISHQDSTDNLELHALDGYYGTVEIAQQEVRVDEEDDHVVLEILYSIIHQLEDESASSTTSAEASVERTITIEPKADTRATPAVSFDRLATCIQSAFRGLCARRAFRLALYQQALACGVLGAMPGTQQGHSGWYQDPKSFMAYYFAVRADGEWVQKAVLRCSALVLTHYAMREQILSRVHIAHNDELV